MYNAEVAPPHLRGAMNILFQWFVTFGILCAGLINYGCDFIDGWGWRLALGLAGQLLSLLYSAEWFVCCIVTLQAWHSCSIVFGLLHEQPCVTQGYSVLCCKRLQPRGSAAAAEQAVVLICMFGSAGNAVLLMSCCVVQLSLVPLSFWEVLSCLSLHHPSSSVAMTRRLA